MEYELAEAAAEKLSKDDRVQDAEVDKNEKGIFVRAMANDRLDARDLKQNLDAYPVFVKVET